MSQELERAQAAATKLIVKSAVNPALWFAGIITPVCFVAALVFWQIPFLCYLLIYAGLGPIILVVGGYVYFMLKDPDRLQSEEFQLRKIGLTKSKLIGEIPNSEQLPSQISPTIDIEQLPDTTNSRGIAE